MNDPSFDPLEFVRSSTWTFAKTMPHIPHWYVVRGRVPEEDFDAFDRLIKASGYRATWRGYENTYLELGGWKYWVIENILNREKV